MTPDRLAVLSQRMSVATLAFIVVMLAVNAAAWVWPSLSSANGGYGVAFSITDSLIASLNQDIAAFPIWQKIGAIVLSSVPLLALSMGLWHLRMLFKLYANGEHFTVGAARHLETTGRAVVMWVILSLICTPLLGVWMTMLNPPGGRLLVIGLTSSDFVALFLAACVIVIARILRRASRIHAENQQFV